MPLPGHIPGVPAIARAYAHFRAHYRPDDPEHRLILDGASRAFTALQERTWSVLDDGTLESAGSRGDTTYVVSDADCRQKGPTRTDKRTGRSEPALCPSFLTTRLTCLEGQGHAQVQLSADAFAELWLPFRPVATSLDLVTLFVDLTDGLVLLSSDDFAAQAQGVLR